LLDLVSEKDAEKGEVPGLERAIPKLKGVEFGSLLHQFAADFSANPYSASVKNILIEVDPTVAARMPKRRAEPSAKKLAEQAAEAAEKEKAAAESKKSAKKEEKKVEKKEAKKEEKKAVGGEKATAKKKAAPPEKPVEPPKKSKGKAAPEPTSSKKKSVTEGLSKRKPR
jgi:hypothetical protein